MCLLDCHGDVWALLYSSDYHKVKVAVIVTECDLELGCI